LDDDLSPECLEVIIRIVIERKMTWRYLLTAAMKRFLTSNES